MKTGSEKTCDFTVWAAIGFLLSVTLLLIFGTFANADPRIEEECHFVYDAANADMEIKDQNCAGGWIHTFEQNGVEYAAGESSLEIESFSLDRTITYVKPIVLYGDDTFPLYPSGGQVQANSDCVMVTRNWDNGAQAYNYTEYRTRNWVSTVEKETTGEPFVYRWRFKTVCRFALEQ